MTLLPPDRADTVCTQRALVIADLRARGGFDRAKRLELAREWGVTEHAIREYNRAATAVLASDRGQLEDTRETSIAYATERRNQARANADRQMEIAAEAKELAETAEDDAVRVRALATEASARRYADAAGKLELGWHEHADKISGALTQGLGAANPLTNPEVMALMKVQAAILDALYPGASGAVAEGAQAWSTGGTVGLKEWLEERQRDAGAVEVSGE